MLIFAGVLAFLAGPAVTTVGMTKSFQNIDGTGGPADKALEESIAIALRITAIGIPVGLLCLGAGICCYVVAARLNRQTGAQNSEIPAA